MDPAMLTTTLIGLALTGVSLLSQVALWQRKEYRFDRLWAYLTSAEFSRRAHTLIISATAVTIVGWLIFLTGATLPAELLGWLSLGLLALHYGRRTVTRGLFRPDPTLKANVLLIISALIILLYIFITISPLMLLALQWATVIILVPELTALVIPLVNVPFELRKEQVIHKAKKMRREHRKLTVVGITGSYGKTSTKFFLDQILRQADMHTAASRAHRNDTYPIALDMLEQLEPGLRVYIAEMGAYRQGEITRMVNLTQPRLGIVTAISNQHVALFGSLEKLARAKWELIQGLPDRGTAILNADDATVAATAARSGTPKHTIWYSTQKPADVYASDTVVQTRHVRTIIHFGETNHHVRLPLISDALLGSVVAAVAAAHALEVAPDTIFESLKKITPPPQTMELRAGRHGSAVIDDSYSANEAGVHAALRHLGRFSEPHKVVVMTPLIELGSEAKSAHLRIGQTLRDINASVFMSGTAHVADIREGAGRDIQITPVSNPADLAQQVASQLNRDTVILLEGRVPDVVRSSVLT